jgi:hypothetical protein
MKSILGFVLYAAQGLAAGQIAKFATQEAADAAGEFIDFHPSAVENAQSQGADVVEFPILTEQEREDAAAAAKQAEEDAAAAAKLTAGKK